MDVLFMAYLPFLGSQVQMKDFVSPGLSREIKSGLRIHDVGNGEGVWGVRTSPDSKSSTSQW